MGSGVEPPSDAPAVGTEAPADRRREATGDEPRPGSRGEFPPPVRTLENLREALPDVDRILLINATEPEETRIALLEDGRLQELLIERHSKTSILGNIYKGRVVNVHASLQAAFVDIGTGVKNGFLHASEIYPDILHPEKASRTPNPHRRPIHEVLSVGQEILVQVIREGIGEKGPSLSMEVSFPGRYLVLSPLTRGIGVSKRISDPRQRAALRTHLRELQPPPDMGFIIRTVGADVIPQDLQNDMDYLTRVWRAVQARGRSDRAPSEIFHERDAATRMVRDIFNGRTREIWVDSDSVHSRLLDYFDAVMPRFRDRLRRYEDPVPLFHRHGVDRQIEALHQKTVPLPSGGSIVIEQTEALVAIDVNSGRFTRQSTPEETALQTDLEAAREIARQLRLRDMGGVIIVDFIDVRLEKNLRTVQRALADETARDRAKMTILPMSEFCIVEMARQRVRPGIGFMGYEKCPHCAGSGWIKSLESVSLELLRQVKNHVVRADVAVIELTVSPAAAEVLEGPKKRDLDAITQAHGKRIQVRTDRSFPPERGQMVGYSATGEQVVDFLV